VSRVWYQRLEMKDTSTTRTISVLGSGWLGRPLAEHLVRRGYRVRASTTTQGRLAELESLGVEPFVVDIGQLADAAAGFFRSDVLIVNIPAQNVRDFRGLVSVVESSSIGSVLLVSATSVYPDGNKTIVESDGGESAESPRTVIERLFQASDRFRTTVVRLGGLIGYSRHPGRFFGVDRVVRDPDAPVNLIHRDDCLGILGRIVDRAVWGEVFNGCADTHPTRREFYTRAARAIGAPVPEFASEPTRSFKIISNHKVKRVLDYEFAHPDLMRIRF
jgi:nucleoside-diphosphate-sugar epimerase